MKAVVILHLHCYTHKCVQCHQNLIIVANSETESMMKILINFG